jgi:6-pyruvoyl tetrahydropterin synthase/QueD family protein
MRCLECQAEVTHYDNAHLIECCGLTLQEYSLRHHLPLDLLVTPDQLNQLDSVEKYPIIVHSAQGERARACLEGLRMAGLLSTQGSFQIVRGEIKALDLLLWNLQWLKEYGFRFRQEYQFDELSNRVVARNMLKALRRNLVGPLVAPSLVPPPEFLESLAVCLSHIGELHAGYLFIALAQKIDSEEVMSRLARDYEVKLVALNTEQDASLLRCDTPRDTQKLLALIEPMLRKMPGGWERFNEETPEVTVSKEVVFDSAHFITDHPAKCSNLHGGRYVLHVKIRGRIDPRTGCVVDYGYVKRVVNKLIVDRFDHHNLNYVAGELAWRSSTELLSVYIWERLIAYLPGLEELELYETPQSWCRYRGPTLEAVRERGSNALLGFFQDPALGTNELRRLTRDLDRPRIYAVGGP